jgi:hypothetical protein
MGDEMQKVSDENEQMRKEKNDALEQLKESSRKLFQQQEQALEQEERALANRRSSEGQMSMLLGSIGESDEGGGLGDEFMAAFTKRLVGSLSAENGDGAVGAEVSAAGSAASAEGAEGADGAAGAPGGGVVVGGDGAASGQAAEGASSEGASSEGASSGTPVTEGEEEEGAEAARISGSAGADGSAAAAAKTDGDTDGAGAGAKKAEAKGGIQLHESQAVDTFTDSESDTERVEGEGEGGGAEGAAEAAKRAEKKIFSEKQRLAKIQQFLEQDLGRMNTQFVEMKEKLLAQTEQMEVLATSDESGLKTEIMKQQELIGTQEGQLKQTVEDLEQTSQHNNLLENKLKNRDDHIKNLEVALAETQKMYRSIQSSHEMQQHMEVAAAAGVTAHTAATAAQLPSPPQRRGSGHHEIQEGGEAVFIPQGWGSASSTPESRFVQNARIRKPIIGGRIRRGRASSKDSTDGGNGGGRNGLRILRQSSSSVMERANHIAQSPSTTAAMAKMRSAMSVVSAFGRKTTATVSNVLKDQALRTPNRRSSLGSMDEGAPGSAGSGHGSVESSPAGFEQTRFELTTQQSGDGWESGKVFIPEPEALPAAELRERLVKFYREHNEAKVEIVDQVVDCYLADQPDLNSELRKTYGVDLHSDDPAASPDDSSAIKVMRQDSDDLELEEEEYDSEGVVEDDGE